MTILMLAILGAGVSRAAADEDGHTKVESRRIAREYVVNSPTFVFDGIPDSLEEIEDPMPAGPSAWRFTFWFKCEHAGYGDRSGRVLESKVTAHEALVTVAKGEVVKAELDGEWDMIEQAPADEWSWGDAGKQALYGVLSVFVILILLTLLTRLSGAVISRIEPKSGSESTSA